MSGELKQQFIEAIRLTPDGIAGFLTTEIPEPPTISTPSDVDSAIIANGLAAKYICDLIAPFAGLTPIELLLRIGQHNSVLESAMLAGLEYLEGANAAQGFTVLAPQDGGVYLPGEMRIRCEVTNGTCEAITCAIGEGESFDLIERDGIWQQYVNVEEGELSASFTAYFTDADPAAQIVNFTISVELEPEPGQPPIPIEAQPDPPGGTDPDAQDKAHGQVVTALRKLADAALKLDIPGYFSMYLNVFKAIYKTWIFALKKILKGQAREALDGLIGEADTFIQYVEDAQEGKDPNALINAIGKLSACILRISSLRNISQLPALNP
jgi:hypothetical protein